VTGVSADVIAIDGKTARRSFHKRRGKAAIHMVSAFAARQRLVLGQVKVADKSNEIVAIPALLDMLAIEGAVVTIDAMGCQRDIAQKVLDKKADYILALKGNQGSLREDVELFAAEQKENGFSDTTITQFETVDADHGGIETRTYTVIHDVAWLQERHQWPGLQGVLMVQSQRELPGASGRQHNRARDAFHHLVDLDRCPGYPSSLMIENGLHWVLDMIFRDDECRVRTDHAPANFTNHQAHGPSTDPKSPRQDSIRLRRKVAAWDDDFLASLIAA
jgi:predicted transposase YbfD/YdcC